MSVTSRVVLILEGGYDLTVIPECAAACIKSLLGDNLPWRNEVMPKREARVAIEQTMRSHRQYWTSLNKDTQNVMAAPAIQIEDSATQAAGATATDGTRRIAGSGKAGAESVPDDIQ